MTQPVEAQLPAGLAAADLGEAATATFTDNGATRTLTLISYLTQPLPMGRRLDYALFCDGDIDRCQWSFGYQRSNLVVKSQDGVEQAASVLISLPPNLQPGTSMGMVVTVDAFSDGTKLGTVSLAQVVKPLQIAFPEFKPREKYHRDQEFYVVGEICGSMREYVRLAAAATGANGVPPHLVAAILFREGRNRPGDLSPKAQMIREALAGQEFHPRWQEIDPITTSDYSLDDIREVEIDLVFRRFFNENMTGISRLGGKSAGVGQIQPATAAMALGKTTWRQLPATSRPQTIKAIQDDFKALSLDERIDVFNQIRFPKRNAWLVANILTRSKNATNRYPTLTGVQLLDPANRGAVEIIATEYNLGATDTPAASATPTSYGQGVAAWMFDNMPMLNRFFPP